MHIFMKFPNSWSPASICSHSPLKNTCLLQGAQNGERSIFLVYILQMGCHIDTSHTEVCRKVDRCPTWADSFILSVYPIVFGSLWVNIVTNQYCLWANYSSTR